MWLYFWLSSAAHPRFLSALKQRERLWSTVCFYTWPFTWQFLSSQTPQCGQVGRKEREKKSLRVGRPLCPGFRNNVVQAASVGGAVPGLPGRGRAAPGQQPQGPSRRPSRGVPGPEERRHKRTSRTLQVNPDVPWGGFRGRPTAEAQTAGAGGGGAPEGPGRGFKQGALPSALPC